MDAFKLSLRDASKYPSNLIHASDYQHVIETYQKRREATENTLLVPERHASVRIVDCYDRAGPSTDSRTHQATNLSQLKRILGDEESLREDPFCRYVFLSLNEAGKMNISTPMLDYLLSYHEVMPAFINFLLSFAPQKPPKFGFRSDIRTDEKHYERAHITELNRSGRRLQLCYSLHNLDNAGFSLTDAWSVRQAVTYHSFDIQTGHTIWIVAETGTTIRDKLLSASRSRFAPDTLGYWSIQRKMKSALAIHRIVCAWSQEEGRVVVEALESDLRDLLRSSDESLQARTGSTTVSKPPDVIGSGPVERGIPDLMRDLRRAQELDNRVNEALTLAEINRGTVDGLLEFYNNLSQHEGCPEPLNDGKVCRTGQAKFRERVANVLRDLDMFASRLQGSSRKLAAHRSLVEVNMRQAQIGAFEKLTTADPQTAIVRAEAIVERTRVLMHGIRQDADATRIMTLFTCFLMPGIFLSVMLSFGPSPNHNHNHNHDEDCDRDHDHTLSKSGAELSRSGCIFLYLGITVVAVLLVWSVHRFTRVSTAHVTSTTGRDRLSEDAQPGDFENLHFSNETM